MMKITLVRYVLVLLFAALSGCGGRVELLKDISEAEANEAMAVLINAGISSSKIPGKEGLVSLDVEQSQVARAIKILGAEGLPRERFARMGDVFRKEGLISSPIEERARYIWALSQELSATLSQIDGVIKARVHVVLPEKTGGGEPTLPSSAAVFIKHKQRINLDDSIPQIKRLVSNSIPGLSADKVTIVMVPSIATVEVTSGEAEVKTKKLTNSDEKPKAVMSGKEDQKNWILPLQIALLVVVAAGGLFFFNYLVRRRRRDPSAVSHPATN